MAALHLAACCLGAGCRLSRSPTHSSTPVSLRHLRAVEQSLIHCQLSAHSLPCPASIRRVKAQTKLGARCSLAAPGRLGLATQPAPGLACAPVTRALCASGPCKMLLRELTRQACGAGTRLYKEVPHSVAAERKGHGSKARGHQAPFPPPTRLELVGTTSEEFEVR